MPETKPYWETKEYWKSYYKKNRKKRIRAVRKSQLNNKMKVFKKYSNGKIKCEICENNDMDVLTLDHINGGGNKHRRELGGSNFCGGTFYTWIIKNNYPDGFRVLCRNCNFKEYLKSKNKNTLKQVIIE